MNFVWITLVAVAALFIKENLCVPAIRPLSQRAIIFPSDNWDDCFVDEASTRPGLCKRLEECPEELKKWEKQNIYPKTCYFIKEQQFVCCPTTKSDTVKPNIFNTNAGITTNKPGNIFLDIFNTDPTTFSEKAEYIEFTTPSKRPSNIFLDGLKDSTTTFTKRPSNIFLDSVHTAKTTTKKPTFVIPDIFKTEKPSFVRKRRSEIECVLQNQHKFDTIDINGPTVERTEFPFMAVLGYKSKFDNKIWYPCGGVLISSRFVLTSAHCAEIGGEKPSFVRLGDTNLTDSEKATIKVKQFIVHPNYKSNVTTIHNDIALVEVEQEVNTPTACLWTQHDLPITKLTALGYGGNTRLNDLGANQLFGAALTAIDKLQCKEYYELDDKLKTMDIVDAHLCARDVENVHKSCHGDTGGPLIMELDKTFYVVGITSFGLGCANLPPSIYTRVSSFIDWIEPILWPDFDVRFDRK